MTQPEQTKSKPELQTPARRRVLQGLAVPLVMTVVPGSAMAQASTNVCLARSNDEARGIKKAPLFSSSPDGWYRLERQLYKLEVRKPGKSNFTDLDGEYFLGFDGQTFWKLTKSNGKYSATKTSYLKGSPDVRETAKSKKTYAVAYVDQSGTPHGFGMENTTSGSIASTSCWNSLQGLASGSSGSKFLKF
ncbi:MAG TPA: hypothetical protein VJM53_04110 [Burkholderiales bacterium]|nr:hypothetical protein [Burkholderiales bacterium]